MSKCKISGKVLSIQLSRDEMLLALIGPGGDVLYRNTLAIPAGTVEDGLIHDQEQILTLLKQELEKEELKKVGQVVYSLCTSQVISQTVTTPNLTGQRLERLLQANADMYFQISMRDYRLMWQVIGPKGRDAGLPEMLVQLWAVPTAILSGYYQVANACGLSVVGIDYCGHSIATAVGASFARTAKAAKAEKARQKLSLNMEISFKKKPEEAPEMPEEPRNNAETQLYISLYKDLAGMTFVQDDQVVYQRFIPCGADPMDQCGELAMMVEYFRSLDVGRGSHITGYVWGPGVKGKADIRELTDYLGIQVSAFEEVYDTAYTLCVGAAQTTLDFGDPSQNHPVKVVSQVGNQIGQYALVLVGGAALIGVILLTLSSRLVWDSSIKDLESTRLTLTIQVQNTKDYADNYNRYQSAYNKYSSDWETIFGSVHTYNDNLVKMLEELEEILPTNASVSNMQISYDGMTVQFACENKEVAAYLIMALRELEYAELMSISNLSGGGGGPATSYGPQVENAPTEGGYQPLANSSNILVDMMAEMLDDEAILQLAMSLTPTEIDQLYSAYGKDPTTSYNTLQDLKNVKNPTLAQRQAALREMLTTNPFVMNRFAELVEEDLFYSYPPILMGDKVFMEIMSDPDLMDAFGAGGLDAATVYTHREKLVNILVKDEENVSATEALLATNAETAKWNVYYLEVELGMQTRESFPFLDMEQVYIHVVEKRSFDTGNKELDAKLNALVPQELWDMLDVLYPPVTDDPVVPPVTDGDDPVVPPVTGGDDPVVPPVTGGDDPVDPDVTKNQLITFMNKYLTDGTTGNLYMDTAIEGYLNKGTTGDKNADKLINEIINDYMTTGTTGNSELDAKIDNLVLYYMQNGATGYDYLDSLIAKQVKILMNNYIYNNGQTGIERFDQLIKDYISGDLPITPPVNGGVNGGSSGNGAGSTPVYFTVSLKYKQELMDEELDRKGFDYDEKLEQEVTVG